MGARAAGARAARAATAAAATAAAVPWAAGVGRLGRGGGGATARLCDLRCYSTGGAPKTRGGHGVVGGDDKDFSTARAEYRREMQRLRAEFSEEYKRTAAREAEERARAGQRDETALAERKRLRKERAAENIARDKERQAADRERKVLARTQNVHVSRAKAALDEWYKEQRLDSSEARLRALGWCDSEEDLDVWMETKLDRVQSLVSPRSLAEDADADMWEDRIAKRP